MAPEIEIDLEEEQFSPEDGEPLPDRPLVYEGDVITASMTLAVVLPGDSKESYFGIKHTTRAQPDEDGSDVYERVTTFVTNSVIGSVEEGMAALAEWEQSIIERGQVPHP